MKNNKICPACRFLSALSDDFCTTCGHPLTQVPQQTSNELAARQSAELTKAQTPAANAVLNNTAENNTPTKSKHRPPVRFHDTDFSAISDGLSTSATMLAKRNNALPIVIALAVINALQYEFSRGWRRTACSDNNIYYTLELNFTKSQIQYNFKSMLLNKELHTFTYKFTGFNRIEADGKEITITFNEDRTMMTMTPALTSSAGSENWFHLT